MFEQPNHDDHTHGNEHEQKKRKISVSQKKRFKSSIDLVELAKASDQPNQYTQPEENMLHELDDEESFKDQCEEDLKFSKRDLTNEEMLNYNKVPDIQKLASMNEIYVAYMKLRTFVHRTNIQRSMKLSEKFGANIFFKREDQQVVRSYKLRGAYNKIISIPEKDRKRGIVTASAGNHAQGVSYTCYELKIHCVIFMPTNTPSIKVRAVKQWGKEYVEIKLIGDTYDESYEQAQAYCNTNNAVFVHPFDDPKVIEGQGTIAIEILEDIKVDKIDYLFFPIGGGGLGAGLSSVFKQISKETILIGCEPLGSPSMKVALQEGHPVALQNINTFVDGAAVKKSGTLTYNILKEVLTDVCLVPEGHICSVMIKLFNDEGKDKQFSIIQGILVEPAGALAVAAMDQFKTAIKGKNVVCILSGSNNDLGRMHDIRMLSDMHQGLQYYMFVNFYQKPGALKQFIMECLGPTDEITHIEYTKKTNREKGPALVGIMVKNALDFEVVKQKMNESNITYKFLNPDQEIFKLLL